MTIKGKAVLRGTKGGSGSGNFGHSGRPGKLGGSIPKGAGGGAGGSNLGYTVTRNLSTPQGISAAIATLSPTNQQAHATLMADLQAHDGALSAQEAQRDAYLYVKGVTTRSELLHKYPGLVSKVAGTDTYKPRSEINLAKAIAESMVSKPGIHQAKTNQTPADIMASVAGTRTHLAYNNQKIGTTSRANQLMKGGAGLITVHDNKTRKEVGRWLLNRETGKWNYTPSKNQ